MCIWCENGRLVREFNTGRKDYSQFLHSKPPNSYAELWWPRQRERALQLIKVEKRRAPAEIAAEDLPVYFEELREKREMRIQQCAFGDGFACLACSREITETQAHRSGFCAKCYQKAKRWQKKRLLVKKAGNCCASCGETMEYLSQYDFHHRDSSTKDFNISECINLGQDLLMAELEKCDLLCSNCHRAIEHLFDEEVFKLFEDRRKT